nr:reverse transcriptase domain-containing protein [Tanacetum cinerariifolium]
MANVPPNDPNVDASAIVPAPVNPDHAPAQPAGLRNGFAPHWIGGNIHNNQIGWIEEDAEEEEEDPKDPKEDLEVDLEEDPKEDPEEDDDYDMEVDDETKVIDPYIDDGSNNPPPPNTEDEETPTTSPTISDADGQRLVKTFISVRTHLLTRNSKIVPTGPMCSNLRTAWKRFGKMEKLMSERIDTEGRMKKKFKEQDRHFVGLGCDNIEMDRAVRNVMSDLSGLKKLVNDLSNRFDEYEGSKVFEDKNVLEKELVNERNGKEFYQEFGEYMCRMLQNRQKYEDSFPLPVGSQDREPPAEPSARSVPAPYLDDPYVVTRDAANAAATVGTFDIDDDDDTTPIDSQPYEPHMPVCRIHTNDCNGMRHSFVEQITMPPRKSTRGNPPPSLTQDTVNRMIQESVEATIRVERENFMTCSPITFCGNDGAVGESQFTGPELVRETTKNIVQIKNRVLTARSRQKSYADLKRRLTEFEVIERIGPVAYKLELHDKLRGIHDTFHVSNLKRCFVIDDVVISLDEVQLNDKLHFVEKPVEIMAREVKRLKQSRIPIVKVCWNSRRGPEFTWEREDFFRSKLQDQKLRDKANDQCEKFFQIFKDLNFNISFADAFILMPKFGPSIKSLLTNKDKLCELARTPLNEHCSTVLLKKLTEKLEDPDKFLIPWDFPEKAECLALVDLGASINLMPLFVWNMLSLLDLTHTCMTLELVDRSISCPVRVAEDAYVKVGTFYFSADFVVVDFDADPRVPLILERSFLKTRRALIDVFEGELTLRVGKEAITFNLDQTLRYSANYSDMTTKRIDVIDMACEEYSQEVLGFSDVIASGSPTPYYVLIVSTTSLTLTSFGNSDFLLEEVDAFLALEDDPTSPEVDQSYLDSEGDILLLEELKIYVAKFDKSSIDEPPEVELKDLPPYLEYAFMEGDDKLPVIIAKDLSMEEKTALITVLKSHKRVIAWKLSDIKGIDPKFCTHKILIEEDFEPAVQHQEE